MTGKRGFLKRQTEINKRGRIRRNPLGNKGVPSFWGTVRPKVRRPGIRGLDHFDPKGQIGEARLAPKSAHLILENVHHGM